MSHDILKDNFSTLFSRCKNYWFDHVRPTWAFLAKFRFIFYAACIFFTPHVDTWDRMFEADNPESELDDGSPEFDCTRECDIAVFERSDLVDPREKLLPRWTYLVAAAVCFFSNDIIKICQPFFLKFYVLWLPVPTFLITMSAVVVVANIKECDWKCIVLPIITLFSIIYDWLVMYHLLFKKRKLSRMLVTILEVREDEKMTIMEIARELNRSLELLDKHYFMKNTRGILVNEVIDQLVDKETKRVYDIPRYVEIHLDCNTRKPPSTQPVN